MNFKPLNDYARIRTKNNGIYFIYEDGRVFSMRVGRFLLQHPDRSGYMITSLNGYPCYVHVLVAHAFLGPKPEGMEVNHKNGNKADNSIQNLEYVTHQENIKHSYAELGRKGYTGKRRKPGPVTRQKMALAKFKSVKATNTATGDILQFDSVAELLDHFNIGRRKFNRWMLHNNPPIRFEFI